MANARNNSRHKQETILFILMGLIIIGLVLSGYFLFTKKILPELSSAETNPGQSSSGAQISSETLQKQAEEEFIPQEDLQILRVYFPGRGKDKLESELRRVRKRSMLIAQGRQIVETILEGPSKDELYQAIPLKTTLRGLFFDSGIFIVDLSREFSAIGSLGASEQALAIYSIVNSLTELDPKARVRILVNGSEADGEKGHIDISRPMTRMESLISHPR